MTDPASLAPAFAALLADPRAALRPPRADMPMAAYRARLDSPMIAATGPALPEVTSAWTPCGVPMRLYRPTPPPAATILFMHGGGFVAGSLETHDALCRMLALASGARVVSVGYRLAPEATQPAAQEDCAAALRWVATTQSSARLLLCGDSAGGYLAAMTALHAPRDGIAVAGLGLFYPAISPACATPSWQRLGEGHMLTRDWMRWAWSTYLCAAANKAGDGLLAAELGHLPPTHVITAAFDPLRDEGEAFVAAIAAQGGTATLTCYPGMIHGFVSLPRLTSLADRAITEMATTLLSQQQC